ncbi:MULTISPECIES: phage holin family protein [Persicobacter]|uniref:Phage holin family protein n=1 Tax=Persicobacter diffluens TaxID=981 RepID=A0AAN4W122_9BACT|nr:phage holin family protein [Persicobacter sp. CCB-QB2]GJM62357.1 hypothetical protein PEDI_29090 [Persicobacter diffluens]
MKKETSNIESLVSNLTGYVESRIELAKLQVGEQAAWVLSRALISIVLIFLFGLFFLFATIALGYFLNAVLNSVYLGFVIIAGFYLLIIVLIAALRAKIINTIMNWFYEIMETMEEETNE